MSKQAPTPLFSNQPLRFPGSRRRAAMLGPAEWLDEEEVEHPNPGVPIGIFTDKLANDCVKDAMSAITRRFETDIPHWPNAWRPQHFDPTSVLGIQLKSLVFNAVEAYQFSAARLQVACLDARIDKGRIPSARPTLIDVLEHDGIGHKLFLLLDIRSRVRLGGVCTTTNSLANALWQTHSFAKHHSPVSMHFIGYTSGHSNVVQMASYVPPSSIDSSTLCLLLITSNNCIEKRMIQTKRDKPVYIKNDSAEGGEGGEGGKEWVRPPPRLELLVHKTFVVDHPPHPSYPPSINARNENVYNTTISPMFAVERGCARAVVVTPRGCAMLGLMNYNAGIDREFAFRFPLMVTAVALHPFNSSLHYYAVTDKAAYVKSNLMPSTFHSARRADCSISQPTHRQGLASTSRPHQQKILILRQRPSQTASREHCYVTKHTNPIFFACFDTDTVSRIWPEKMAQLFVCASSDAISVRNNETIKNDPLVTQETDSFVAFPDESVRLVQIHPHSKLILVVLAEFLQLRELRNNTIYVPGLKLVCQRSVSVTAACFSVSGGMVIVSDRGDRILMFSVDGNLKPTVCVNVPWGRGTGTLMRDWSLFPGDAFIQPSQSGQSGQCEKVGAPIVITAMHVCVTCISTVSVFVSASNGALVMLAL